MRKSLRTVFSMVMGLTLCASTAQAQWMYPGGYGGWGWGGWGADPASGYMAGLGAYARGQGVYEVEDAKAQAINLDTTLKWNKALRARQKALRKEAQENAANQAAARDERVARQELEDGTTVNQLLGSIYDYDPIVSKASRARTAIPADTIHDIPFEWDTEAISICIDQMTAKDALPAALTDEEFVNERANLRKAVEEVLKEDTKGNVTSPTKKRLTAAINAFRDKFTKDVPKFDATYNDAANYFTTLASLTKLLNDSSMKKILAQLGKNEDVPVGKLITFMHSYNLRFGPATTDRQRDIYRNLAPLLTQVMQDTSVQPAPAPAVDRNGKDFQNAARDAFKGMDWKNLQQHDKDQ